MGRILPERGHSYYETLIGADDGSFMPLTRTAVAPIPHVDPSTGVPSEEPRRWNRRLSKAFDVARAEFPARSAEEALVAKYLEVDIKLLERREVSIPSVRLGAFLTAVDDVLRTWSVDDVRNLNYRGEETPPSYDIIQLNSTKSADFLIDGMRFVRQADLSQVRATVRVEPAWYGLDVTVYGMRSLGTAATLLTTIQARAKEINFLKGEAFSLSGEFLPKTEETFADLFLDPKNAAALERVISLVNTKGKALENRGVLLMGPPGTGKTLAARIVRNQAKATFIWVSSRDFHYSGSFGGFSQAFDLARECAPSVVVFEDIDNWLYDTTVDLIKTEMDGVKQSAGVVTILTSNFPELLPAALIDRPGRFHDVLKFDLPTDDARKAMLVQWLPGLAPADLTRAVSATKGYSGAHVRELARFAAIIAEQDALPLSQALTAALTKLAEQRDLITATQRAGSRYRMAPDLVAKTAGQARRAYALLRVKAIDDTRRILTGIATTPEADRDGDIVEPLGVTFQNPLPFLFHHDAKRPIGTVSFDPPTKDGISFKAEIPTLTEPGALKDRLDEAWQSVKAGLIAGVSIGFRELPGQVEVIKNGGLRFLGIEVYELSLVTVPANAGATIRTIKSLDLAASGRHLPGVTGLSTLPRVQKAARAMTIQEQITGLEHKRAADFARLTEIQTTATADGNTKDAAQREEFDTLKLTLKAIDAELVDLHEMETFQMATATPIKPVTEIQKAAALRGGAPVIHVTPQLPKGTAFTRMCIALFRGKGDSYQTLQHAKSFADTPEVEQMVQHMWTKAAVAPGTTTDATWAGPLAVRTAINEFLELLRPRTLLGQISGFRQVPFNVSVPSQTAGGTYAWVGQGLAKPVTSAAYAAVTLDFAKAAGIIVISEELAKLSTPSAEGLVREELIGGMGGFLDVQLVDPAVAVGANLNPASITNGAATIVASGVTGAAAKLDLASRVAVFTAANIPLLGSVWLMSDSNAFGLGLSVNALGQPLFPGLSITGGSIFGIPVVVSNNVGNRVILVHAPSILYADEGGVQIDVSREASLQMSDAPDSPGTTATVLVSLWQNNLVGLRAERMITWKRARTAAVTYISAAAYIGT
jgi:HK97 family phage major capsid protein/HK97 family phage prohead protease